MRRRIGGSLRCLALGGASVFGLLSFIGAVPAVSQASVILGSPLSAPTDGTIGTSDSTFVQTALPEPSALLASPVDGTVVAWSLRGTFINLEPNTFKLRVLRPVGNGTFTAVATSAEESTPHTGSNDDLTRRFQTALPIRAGDAIGLTTIGGASVPVAEMVGATSEYFEAVFPDGGSSGVPTVFGGFQKRELLFDAEVVAAPTSSATVPACARSGKMVVNVATDPATTPKAVLFRIDTGVQRAAPATAGVATIAIPAGRHRLEYWAEDAVPQQEVAHRSATLRAGARACGTRPLLSAVSQTHRVWREGNRLATVSRKPRPPIGTTFSFRLNEKARVSFKFTQKLAGRRVKSQGSISFAAHSGTNRVAFQGRLSASKKLPPGHYTLVITARDSAGRRAQPRRLGFTIVG